MAKANVAQVAANDAQNLLCEATSLSQLIDWIERAKFLCDYISTTAQYDQQLADSLRDAKIAYCNACWDTDQSDGLVHLIGHQRRLIEEASHKIGGPNAV